VNSSTAAAVLIVWNLIACALMGIDKYKAVKNRQRIRENTLFLCAFLLGGIGVLCGMYIFRHKTKHLSFKILVPAAVAVNIIIYYFLFLKVL
jgi:uncharacterized membrane protein YsdA (DUF1294 family)